MAGKLDEWPVADSEGESGRFPLPNGNKIEKIVFFIKFYASEQKKREIKVIYFDF